MAGSQRFPSLATASSPLQAPSFADRAEASLAGAIAHATRPGCPPRLAAALRHAVFPGGARVRPQLCLAAATACGDVDPALADAAAAAIELLHSASLVHDDLPCFDDAGTRRGLPSVHRAYGEPLAVLAGDALIVLSFERVARLVPASPSAGAALLAVLAEAAGTTRGIVCGQAWESEPAAPLDAYHHAKTASLFEAAAVMGALAAGADPAPFRAFGESVGRAYQAADDLRDALGTAAALGKPTGRDALLGRPSLVRARGVSGAKARLAELVAEVGERIPRCDDPDAMVAFLAHLRERVTLA